MAGGGREFLLYSSAYYEFRAGLLYSVAVPSIFFPIALPFSTLQY